MKILSPNTGKEVILISKSNIYISVTDFGQKSILKEIKVGPGQHTWYWVVLNRNKFVDISYIDNNYCSFDNAINKYVNDAYCSVYEFENFDEVINKWENIKYIDNISTIYKTEEK